MSTATAGRAREYKIRDLLAESGWVPIMRAAASKGAADLLLAHPERGPILVQVGTASKALGPADRERFTTVARLCRAQPVLATAGGRKPVTFHLVTLGVPSTWDAWVP